MGKTVSTLSTLLSLDASGFEAGVSKARKASDRFRKDATKDAQDLQKALGEVGSGFAKSIGGFLAAGFAIDAIKGKFEATMQAMENIDKQSRKLQINPESFQELGYISKQTGVDVEALVKGAAKLPKVLGEAANESSPLNELFGKLKLDVGELQQMNPDKAFLKVVDALKGVEGANERAYYAMEIFGKSGNELLPLMYENMGELSDKATELGLIVSQDGVNSVKIMGDQFADLGAQTDAVWQNTLVGIAPIGTAFASMASDMVKDLGGPAKIAEYIIFGLATVGDVAATVISNVKGVIGVVATAITGLVGAILKSIEYVGTKLNDFVNVSIAKVSKLKEALGGDEIKFRFGAVDLGSEQVLDFTKALWEESNKSFGPKSNVSEWIAKVTDKQKEQAKALSEVQNKTNKAGGAYEALGANLDKVKDKAEKVEKALKSIVVTLKSMSVDDIASKGGNSSNALAAKRIQDYRKRADEARARGNEKEYERLTGRADNLEQTRLRKVYTDDRGKVGEVRGRGTGSKNTIGTDLSHEEVQVPYGLDDVFDDAKNFGKGIFGGLIGGGNLQKITEAWDKSGEATDIATGIPFLNSALGLKGNSKETPRHKVAAEKVSRIQTPGTSDSFVDYQKLTYEAVKALCSIAGVR